MPMSMDYREYILDHYRNPRNYGRLEHPDAHAEDSNPLCGDQLAIDLQIEGDKVTAVRFQGRGCAISRVSASILFLPAKGRSLPSVRAAPSACRREQRNYESRARPS